MSSLDLPMHDHTWFPFANISSIQKQGVGLDTMVWSSAQPRNVDDMVHHVFGDLANDLKAIWTRYAWLNLRDVQWVPLLDDSTTKASLQPWNHILVKECRVEEHKHDLGVFSHKIRPANLPNHTPRKALEKEKEISAMTDKLSSKLSLKDSEEQCDRYDDFLLAVVGILDALEYENSVTAWLTSGGIVLAGKKVYRRWRWPCNCWWSVVWQGAHFGLLGTRVERKDQRSCNEKRRRH